MEYVGMLQDGNEIREVDTQLVYSKKCKIANGSDGAQVFVGLMEGEPVAVKRIDKEKIANELHIFSSLKSKPCHILPLLDYKEDEDFAYIVTPLCEYNLEEVIENKQCPWRVNLSSAKRTKLCMDFLLGLKELHDAGILHRDLKPSNLLIGKMI